MRIVVIGSDGQLGSDLMRVLEGKHAIGLSHQNIEITDFLGSQKMLEEYSPDIIINTAAYNKVDDAEDEPELAFQVNAFGPRNLALIARELGATLVHISTDYVFNGAKTNPYFEWDLANPLSVYGASKLAGENLVKIALREHPYFIIRTSGLYGQAGSKAKRGNFVETILRLAEKRDKIFEVVNDQILTPTYTLDLAEKIVELIMADKTNKKNFYNTYQGICHITNNGSCSWYEFAKKIFELAGLEMRVVPISSKQFGAKAKRPGYSVLNNVYLRILDLKSMRPWQEALRAYLEETGRIKRGKTTPPLRPRSEAS